MHGFPGNFRQPMQSDDLRGNVFILHIAKKYLYLGRMFGRLIPSIDTQVVPRMKTFQREVFLGCGLMLGNQHQFWMISRIYLK